MWSLGYFLLQTISPRTARNHHSRKSKFPYERCLYLMLMGGRWILRLTMQFLGFFLGGGVGWGRW